MRQLLGLTFPGLRAGRLKPVLNPPDLQAEHGSAILLVWGKLPHWMVVDREFYDLLFSFDGQRAVGDGVGSWTRDPRERARLFRQIDELIALGVLRLAGAPTVRRREDAVSSKIANVSVNVTRRCNLRCRFCYNLTVLQDSKGNELTAEETNGFLRSLRDHLSPRPSLFLLGGEPLLDLDKVLTVGRFAAGAGFEVVVSTNGAGITSEFARAARQAGMQVQVSLDGHTAAIHDSVRGSGSYLRAIRGIERLVRAGVHTLASMVCLAENLPHIEAFYGLAASLKVNEARVIPLKRLGGATQSGTPPVPLRRILRELNSMLERHPEYLSLMGRDCLSILAGQCRMAQRRSSCGTGVQTLLLDADGTLYPCLNTNRPEFAFGNIRESGFDFGRAWEASPVLTQVRRETSVEVEGNACADCLVKYWCLGGCHGETYAFSGSLGGRSPDCAELHEAVTDMMWTLSTRPGWARGLRSHSC